MEERNKVEAKRKIRRKRVSSGPEKGPQEKENQRKERRNTVYRGNSIKCLQLAEFVISMTVAA